MADSIRLFGQFKDEQGSEWKVALHDSEFSGTATEIKLASDGFILQYQGDNESRMQAIIGSAVSFAIQVESSAVEGVVGLIETSEEGRFTCTVTRDPDGTPSLFWSGIVLPDQVVIRDEYFPILVQLRAVDDLGNLRNVKYKSGGVGYGGEATFSQHLLQCILKLRHVQNITWGDPLVWWANNFTATGISPLLDQISRVGVHHAAFYNRNEDGEAQFLSAFEVLKQICETLNCRLFQHEGAFWMVPVGIYGTFTGSATWDFYNVDGPGNVSSATSIDVGKFIGTDVVRMVGNEMTHLPPLQEVRKIWEVNGDVPALALRQYVNGSGSSLFPQQALGTTVEDAGLAYLLNEQLKLEGEVKAAWTGDSSTGQASIGTLMLRMTVKVGSLYLVNSLSFSTTQWASVPFVSGPQNRRPFTITDAAWQASAGYYYRPIITAVDIGQDRPQENPWLHFIDVVLPELTSQQSGMEITVEAVGFDFEGGSISNFTDAGAWMSVRFAVRKLQQNGEQVEAITYSAAFENEAQTVVEQRLLLGSAEYATGIDGALLDITSTPGDPVATFSSLARPTETAQPIHQIAATEILQGQKYATLIRRGRLFGEFISPLHWLALGTDKFLPFQTTYLANSCETDFEAFKVAFNGTDMQTPSVQGTFTDIDTSGGSVTDVVLPVLEEAIEETSKQVADVITDVDAISTKVDLITITQPVDLDGVEADTNSNTSNITTIQSTLTSVQNKLGLIYETFQPKGDDYGTTSVKYEDGKTDGTAVFLQQQEMKLQSASGNTQLQLSEASPGIIRMDVQDELATPGTQLALYATGRSTTGGSVGINTSSPTANLHVNGTAKITGTLSEVPTIAMATDQDLTPTEGELTYNYDQNAWLLGLAGDEVRSIEDDWWVCKNQTGSTIAAGVPVYASGTLGSSGRKLIAPMVADGSINARYFLGVTAHSISNGADGIVIDRGTIKGVDTSSFSEGDVLWVDQSTAGAFTATEPSSGQKIAAAFVVTDAINGVLAVRNLGEESAAGGGLTAVVDDTSPELGGHLSAAGNYIDFSTNTAGTILVGGNAYAFRYKTGTSNVTNYGLYFNLSNTSMEIKTADGSAVFGVHVGTGQITTGAITLPAADGTAGQVLQTDGSGTVSFSDLPAPPQCFAVVAVAGQSDVVADVDEDTLTMVAGSNVVLTTDAVADSITIAVSSTPTFTSLLVNSGGIVSVGSISTLGSLTATGNLSAGNGTFSGNATFQGSLQAGTAILSGIQFTGGGTTSIGIATGLPNQPSDLQITSNGNVTVLLDADTDETGQKFAVHDPSGTERFSVDDSGAATFNSAFTLPTADGTAGQSLQTDGAGNVGWASAAGGKSSSFSGYMEITSNSITRIFTGPSNGTFSADFTSGNTTSTTYNHNGTAPTAGSSTLATYPYYVRGGLIDLHHDCSTISVNARLRDSSQNAAGDGIWMCVWHLSGGAAETFTQQTWTAIAVGTGSIPSTSANITLGLVTASATGLSLSAGDSIWITFGWIDQPAATPDVAVNWSINLNE